jgi:methyl-accepting chemotaxis protein
MSVILKKVEQFVVTNMHQDFVKTHNVSINPGPRSLTTIIDIAHYLRHPLILTEETTNQETYEIMKLESNECAVVCNGESEPIGLVMKNHFYQRLSTLYGSALHYRHSITTLMDKHSLILENTVPIEEIIDLALNRDEKFLYDCIIITMKCKLLGILTCGDLLKISRLLQQKSIEQEIQTVSNTKQKLIQIDDSCIAVVNASEKGAEISGIMFDITVSGKAALQKVLDLFHGYNDITIQQKVQI